MCFLGPQALDAQELLALVGQILGFFLIVHDVECLAGSRGSVESEHRHRSGGVGLGYFLSALVEHGLDPAVIAAAEDDVSHVESSVLYQDSGQIAASFVEGGLDDRTFGHAVRVGLELKQVGFQQDFLEELVHVGALLGRYLLTLILAAPVLHQDVHVGKLLADAVGIGSRLVYLVDGKYHGNAGRLGMVDGLYGLGHDGVVGGHDDDDQVGNLRSSGTHGGEGLVARSVEEGDAPAVGQLYIVGSDVLGDASGLSGYDVGLADVVQQGCFTVVHMTHDGDDGRTLYQICRIVHFLLNLAFLIGGDELYLVSEFLGHQHEGIGIETLVDGDHQAQVHAGLDDFGHRDVHHDCQIVDCHKFGHLEYSALKLLLLAGLLHLLGDHLAFLSLVLGTLGLALAFGHTGVGLLDLLLYQILVYLHTYRLGFLLAVLPVLVVTAFLVAALLTAGVHFGYVHLLALTLDALALAVAVSVAS